MTRSMFKFGLPLTLALAAACGSAVAQQKDQSSATTPVQVTIVGRSYTGIPIEQYSSKRAVSYANLDLSTPSGAAELKKRVRETAREACEQLQAAYPLDLSDDDDDNNTCVSEATAGAMKQAKAAIAAANSASARTKTMSPG
jgi:UrcA family protein